MPAGDSPALEAAFVEAFWTERWRDRASPPNVAQVARRDEYGVIAPVLARLPRGSRILDGGCGLGEWTVFLSQHGFDVTGMDISRATVERLQRWFPDHRFIDGDLRQTAFPDGAFDAYFSWGTFEHFESGIGECVAEARRLLRPGGWLFVSVPFDNWRMRLTAAPVPRPGERFYQWRFTRTELRRELERGGFQVHRLDPIAKDTGASRWLKQLAPGLPPGSFPFRVLRRAISTLAPGDLVAHMVLATSQRR